MLKTQRPEPAGLQNKIPQFLHIFLHMLGLFVPSITVIKKRYFTGLSSCTGFMNHDQPSCLVVFSPPRLSLKHHQAPRIRIFVVNLIR